MTRFVNYSFILTALLAAANPGVSHAQGAEGPQERALDQSLATPDGVQTQMLPAPALPAPPPVSSPATDADIEARINAAAAGKPTGPAVPARQTAPRTLPPARWEGPDERALDAVDPNQPPVPYTPSPYDPEAEAVRRLNGG